MYTLYTILFLEFQNKRSWKLFYNIIWLERRLCPRHIVNRENQPYTCLPKDKGKVCIDSHSCFLIVGKIFLMLWRVREIGGNFSYNITYVDFFHEKVFYIKYFSCPSEVTIQKSKHSNQPLNVGKAFHFQHPSGLVKRWKSCISKVSAL